MRYNKIYAIIGNAFFVEKYTHIMRCHYIYFNAIRTSLEKLEGESFWLKRTCTRTLAYITEIISHVAKAWWKIFSSKSIYGKSVYNIIIIYYITSLQCI